MCDEKKTIQPEANEPKKQPEQQPEQPEKKPGDDAAVLYDPSELSDDDLEGMSTEEMEDTEGAGYFFVPVFIAANVNLMANINVGANANVAANAMAAANVVAAANAMGVANANAMTNVNVTD